MKILITGAAGQLGQELQGSIPKGIKLIALNRSQLDISDSQQVNDCINEAQADWVINAAAYTAVDRAEQDKTQAYLINYEGAKNIALSCHKSGAKMLQISTDFVFDGTQRQPYQTSTKTNPLSIYGASKLKGEEAVMEQLDDQYCILRTSWLYSVYGNNFVKTMVKLMQNKPELNIVSDQTGSPTWAKGLAQTIWQLIIKETTGIHHWSDSGMASWYDFANAIYEESMNIGLINNQCHIKPIQTEQYPVDATRPQYSVLDKTKTMAKLGIEPEPWRSALHKMLIDLKSYPGT